MLSLYRIFAEVALSFIASFTDVAFSLASFTLSNAVDFVELALSVIDLSLSFAAFFISAFVLSTIDFELVTTSSLLAIRKYSLLMLNLIPLMRVMLMLKVILKIS